MSRTSGIANLQKPRHPLILIPGFLGTKLRDRKTHKVAWGTMANIFTGRENDALSVFEDIVRKNPLDAFAHHRLGEIYGRRGPEFAARATEHLEAAERLRHGHDEGEKGSGADVR